MRNLAVVWVRSLNVRMKTPIFIIIPLLTILLVIGMPIFEPDMLDSYLECNGKTSVTIPLTVTTIGGWDDYPVEAFLPCTNLTSINVNKRNLAFSSIDGVLFDKSKQTLLAYPRGKQGAYNIPNGVSTIEMGAFSNCLGLTSVTVPNSVTTIKRFAFYDCTSLTSITIAMDNAHYSSEDGVLFDKNKTTLILYPAGKQGISYTLPNNVTEIGNEAFESCTNLTSITIPNGVTKIGTSAFSGCTSLTSITIPGSVTSINNGIIFGIFDNCTNLTSINVNEDNTEYCSIDGVLFSKTKNTLIRYPSGKQGTYTIPNSVTEIGVNAFLGCTNLTSVTIPNRVTSIRNKSFKYCRNLRSITIQNPTPPNVESSVFDEISPNACFYVPAGSITAYRDANGWKEFNCIKAIASAPE